MVVLYHVVALPVLPYPYDGLEPWLSRESVRLHRVLHERYVARTNTIIRGTPLEGQSVEWVVAAGVFDADGQLAGQHRFEGGQLCQQTKDFPDSSGF